MSSRPLGLAPSKEHPIISPAKSSQPTSCNDTFSLNAFPCLLCCARYNLPRIMVLIPVNNQKQLKIPSPSQDFPGMEGSVTSPFPRKHAPKNSSRPPGPPPPPGSPNHIHRHEERRPPGLLNSRAARDRTSRRSAVPRRNEGRPWHPGHTRAPSMRGGTPATGRERRRRLDRGVGSGRGAASVEDRLSSERSGSGEVWVQKFRYRAPTTTTSLPNTTSLGSHEKKPND